MADKQVERAKTKARHEREAAVWKDREDAGRAARQAKAPRVSQGQKETEGGAAPKAGARQRQAAGT